MERTKRSLTAWRTVLRSAKHEFRQSADEGLRSGISVADRWGALRRDGKVVRGASRNCELRPSSVTGLSDSSLSSSEEIVQ